MSALSRFQNKNGKSEETPDETKPAKIIADALREAFSAPLGAKKEPTALEAMAIALGGDQLKFPIGEALMRGAEALEDIAEALHRIADAAEGDNGGKKK